MLGTFRSALASKLKSQIVNYPALAFGADLRSLALMRMGYGLIILVDLAVRSTNLRAHYSDQGVLPLQLMYERSGHLEYWSFHGINGSVGFQALLFGIHALAALALLSGYRTRWATIACFLLAISLQSRNYAVLNGGDNWMRLTLLWAIFLPWGHRWSLDARNTQPKSLTVLSVGSAALIQQIFTVYFLAGIFKTADTWRVTGEAIYLSLHLVQWSSDYAEYLLYYPDLLNRLTFATYWFEVLGPFLFIFPLFTAQLRTFAVVTFFSFHFGLLMGLELGVFAYVGMVTVIGLLPGWAWTKPPLRWMERLFDGLSEQFRKFGSWDWVPPTRPHAPIPNRSTACFVLVFMVLSALWNINSYLYGRNEIPEKIRVASNILRVDQYWALFAPGPSRHGGWIDIEGVLADGSRVDLLRGRGSPTFQRPRSSTIYPTQRWKRLYVVASGARGEFLLPYLARHHFEQWDRYRPERADELRKVRMYWSTQATLPNFEDAPPHRRLLGDFTRQQVKEL